MSPYLLQGRQGSNPKEPNAAGTKSSVNISLNLRVCCEYVYTSGYNGLPKICRLVHRISSYPFLVDTLQQYLASSFVSALNRMKAG